MLTLQPPRFISRSWLTVKPIANVWHQTVEAAVNAVLYVMVISEHCNELTGCVKGEEFRAAIKFYTIIFT